MDKFPVNQIRKDKLERLKTRLKAENNPCPTAEDVTRILNVKISQAYRYLNALKKQN